MTVTEQIDSSKQFQQLWEMLMPGTQPDANQFIVWAGCYDEKTVSRGISRAAAKVYASAQGKKPMSLLDAIRYASGIMRHEADGQRFVRPKPINTPVTPATVLEMERSWNR